MATNTIPNTPVFEVTLGARTHVGMQRKVNQDSMCSIASPNTPAGVAAIVAVADGMGGHKGGEVASSMAIEGVVARLGKKSGLQFSAANQTGLMAEVIKAIHVDVQSAGNTSDTRGMGTTLSIAVIENDRMTIGHVGDSRIYRVRDGQLSQLTEDHSWVAEEVRRGAMTQAEADVHPRRNLVSQAIGATATVSPMVAVFDLKIGDKIMLCSDGLHGLVSNEDLRQTIENMPPDLAVQTLIDKANEAGGSDNITAVIAEIVEPAGDSGRTHLSEMNTVTLKRKSGVGSLGIILLPAKLIAKAVALIARLLIWAPKKLIRRG